MAFATDGASRAIIRTLPECLVITMSKINQSACLNGKFIELEELASQFLTLTLTLTLLEGSDEPIQGDQRHLGYRAHCLDPEVHEAQTPRGGARDDLYLWRRFITLHDCLPHHLCWLRFHGHPLLWRAHRRV